MRGPAFIRRPAATAILWLLGGIFAGALQYAIAWTAAAQSSSSRHSHPLAREVKHSGAGELTGGVYSLEGGFWAIAVANDSPNVPLLRIGLTPTNTVLLTWSAQAVGLVPERNDLLISSNWVALTNAGSVVDGENQVVVAVPPGNSFFRLQRL